MQIPTHIFPFPLLTVEKPNELYPLHNVELSAIDISFKGGNFSFGTTSVYLNIECIDFIFKRNSYTLIDVI